MAFFDCVSAAERRKNEEKEVEGLLSLALQAAGGNLFNRSAHSAEPRPVIPYLLSIVIANEFMF